MRVLLDASAVVAILTPEATSDAARKVWFAASQRLVLDLTFSEVANAIWKKHRRGSSTRDVAEQAIREIGTLHDAVIETSPFAVEAFSLAVSLNHPVYDCLYAIIAEKLEAEFITADRKLHQKLQGLPVSVSLLEASQPH